MLYVLHYCFDDTPTALPVLCKSPECHTPTVICVMISDPLEQAEWIDKYAEANGVSPEKLIFIRFESASI